MLVLLFFVAGSGSAREIVGWLEKARIYPAGMLVKARVDTGARTSSLGANSLDYFERDDEEWVRFTTTNYKGKKIWLERKVYRTARVKHYSGRLQERPVIRLGICLGGVYREGEVNLENRSLMNYQMLIGREFLDGHFLVDPDAVFINPPQCRKLTVIDGQ